MKREIKFRAWDEEGGMMHPPFTINEICEIRKEGGGLGAILMNFNWDQLMWLQFTGLHDKNGVEIYEGDIIKDGLSPRVIEFTRATNVNYGQGDSTTTLCLGYSFYFWGNEVGDIEIIGNIYENPELINK